MQEWTEWVHRKTAVQSGPCLGFHLLGGCDGVQGSATTYSAFLLAENKFALAAVNWVECFGELCPVQGCIKKKRVVEGDINKKTTKMQKSKHTHHCP